MTSPLLSKYLGLYQKDPKSKVFAPLAMLYRNLGSHDEAIKILRLGIKHHPDSILGHLSLATCYSDKGRFDLAYQLIQPLLKENIENYQLVKFLAEINVKLQKNEEALECYKFLLFLRPKDPEFQEMVQKLEGLCGYHEVTTVITNPTYEDPSALTSELKAKEIKLGFDHEESWVEVALGPESSRQHQIQQKKNQLEEAALDDWSLSDPGTQAELTLVPSPPLTKGHPDLLVQQPIQTEMNGETSEYREGREAFEVYETHHQIHHLQQESSPLRESPAKFPASEYTRQNEEQIEEQDEKSEEEESEASSPSSRPSNAVLTHTLVDLYCAQGLYQKGLEILKKMAQLQPHDEKIKKRTLDVMDLLAGKEEPNATVTDLFSERQKWEERKMTKVPPAFDHSLHEYHQIEALYRQFLQEIHKRAQSFK